MKELVYCRKREPQGSLVLTRFINWKTSNIIYIHKSISTYDNYANVMDYFYSTEKKELRQE